MAHADICGDRNAPGCIPDSLATTASLCPRIARASSAAVALLDSSGISVLPWPCEFSTSCRHAQRRRPAEVADMRLTSDTLAADTLSSPAVSRTPRPSSNAARMRCTWNGVVLGLPRRLPDNRARSRPAITRSRIIARSNSLNTPASRTAFCRMASRYRAPAGGGRGRCRGIVARPADRSGPTATVPADTPTTPPRCRTRAGATPLSKGIQPRPLIAPPGAPDALVGEGRSPRYEPSRPEVSWRRCSWFSKGWP